MNPRRGELGAWRLFVCPFGLFGLVHCFYLGLFVIVVAGDLLPF